MCVFEGDFNWLIRTSYVKFRGFLNLVFPSFSDLTRCVREMKYLLFMNVDRIKLVCHFIENHYFIFYYLFVQKSEGFQNNFLIP